jgi:hypothetical protein
MVITTLVSLLGYALFFHKALKLPSSVSPLFGISSLVFILYGASLIDQLALTTSITWYLGVILCPLSFLIKNDSESDYFPFAIFTVLFTLLYFGVRHLHFTSWDEFSFWGTVSKSVYESGALPNQATPLGFKDYPLANTLFQYWIYKGMGQYQEGYGYLAQTILLFIPLLTITQLKPRLKAILGLCFFFLVLAIFDKRFLNSMYVDTVLACTFAGCMISYVLLKHRYKALMLVPTIMLLPLIKQSGLLLAAVSAAGIVMAEWIQYHQPLKKQSNKWYLLMLMLLFPGAIAFSHFSWAHHVKWLQPHNTFNTQAITLKTVYQQFFHNTSPTLQIIKHHFLHALAFKGKGLNRLHIALPFWLFFFLGSWLILKNRIKQKPYFDQITVFYCIIFIGFIIFTLGLLILYLNVYSVYEATRLASFGRYIGTYLLAMILFGIALLVQHMNMSSTHYTKAIHFILIGTTCIGLLHPGHIKMSPNRMKIQAAAKKIESKHIDKNRKFYIIDQGDDGFKHYLYRYTLWPRPISNCYSIKLPKYKSNMWTCPLTVTQWASSLREYDYLLLSHTDKSFWRDFGTIFPESAQQKKDQPSLWRIVPQKNHVRLINIF